MDPRIVNSIAAATGADLRTVRKFLAGQDVRGNVLRIRLAEACKALGCGPAPSK